MALWASADGVEYPEQEREPWEGFRGFPELSLVWFLRGLVARLSHLPKSETDCDVTPPGDAGPRTSVDDDNAEKWAANR
jgi:hypothetical protein